MLDSNEYPLGRKGDIVVQELEGEILIYDLIRNKAFCLNETSALVWQLCDGKTSIKDISSEVCKKLKIPLNEDLVWFALDQLKKGNLIANNYEVSNKFKGMSRREVIRKVGLGTMVAIPIVSSLVAPTATQASSACVITPPTTCVCRINGFVNAGICTAAPTGGTVRTACPDANCRCRITTPVTCAPGPGPNVDCPGTCVP